MINIKGHLLTGVNFTCEILLLSDYKLFNYCINDMSFFLNPHKIFIQMSPMIYSAKYYKNHELLHKHTSLKIN